MSQYYKTKKLNLTDAVSFATMKKNSSILPDEQVTVSKQKALRAFVVSFDGFGFIFPLWQAYNEKFNLRLFGK